MASRITIGSYEVEWPKPGGDCTECILAFDEKHQPYWRCKVLKAACRRALCPRRLDLWLKEKPRDTGHKVSKNAYRIRPL